jgi:hypothetical protein
MITLLIYLYDKDKLREARLDIKGRQIHKARLGNIVCPRNEILRCLRYLYLLDRIVGSGSRRFFFSGTCSDDLEKRRKLLRLEEEENVIRGRTYRCSNALKLLPILIFVGTCNIQFDVDAPLLTKFASRTATASNLKLLSH